ncbi:MAG: endonuclease domain-containing protein [Fimbriimonadaceae bacterium]|nr:endonuclease domain-containing protein [Fimbriimonadaceae bacterium]
MLRIVEASREDLFPNEGRSPKSGRRYYQLHLGPVEKLPEPIVSIRLRLIVFIPTTYFKLETAIEINDLFDESPLEDAIWGELKKLKLRAERQYHIQIDSKWYALDFAIFCREGKIDVETDGDTWHADVDRIPEDNERNNALAAKGWKVLRFNGMQVREQMREYCVPQIVKTVNQLGGLAEAANRTYSLTASGIEQQLHLFDED